MRARFFPLAFAACALAACTDEGMVTLAHDHGRARVASNGRHLTAPLGVGDGVVVGITTRGAGAPVDEGGAIVSALTEEHGDDRHATCVLVRLDEDGAVLWQTPVRADDAQTRCIDLHGARAQDGRAMIGRDDDAWRVALERDGLVRELDQIMRMDTCTPTLAALATAFEKLIDQLIDDTLADVRDEAPSTTMNRLL